MKFGTAATPGNHNRGHHHGGGGWMGQTEDKTQEDRVAMIKTK